MCIRDSGVQISMDDFGSGYTSLSQLRRLPLDEIKIDRPFVQGMVDNKGDRAVVASAIDLAHHFGLTVVAEGVERDETRAALRSLGCELAQGNLFSPPLNAAQLREWWMAHAPLA